MRIPGPVIEIAIVVVLALLIWIFVGIRATPNSGRGCVSLVFDKPFVKGADRIVIYERNQVITLTDKETVRQIADLFTEAGHTDLCDYSRDRRLEIYNGDRLAGRFCKIATNISIRFMIGMCFIGYSPVKAVSVRYS